MYTAAQTDNWPTLPAIILVSSPMPQVSTQEFERLPLRVHTFLTGVPLHDAWSIDLPRWRAGVTLDEFLRTTSDCLCTPPSLVRMLLDIRFFVGRFFGWVYRFENEQLVELINRTAHAAALSTLVETATTYRFYLGVYVRSVSRFTPFYMALIDPFRKLIVYPSLLRSVRARWNQAFGTG